uniref:Uncharacterized protein n=1 Tax=Megaselia scalaris TaxID=36166 RepID=T1GB46_MEGSC
DRATDHRFSNLEKGEGNTDRGKNGKREYTPFSLNRYGNSYIWFPSKIDVTCFLGVEKGVADTTDEIDEVYVYITGRMIKEYFKDIQISTPSVARLMDSFRSFMEKSDMSRFFTLKVWKLRVMLKFSCRIMKYEVFF